MIAYCEQCCICDLWRFSFRTRDQLLITQELFVFHYTIKVFVCVCVCVCVCFVFFFFCVCVFVFYYTMKVTEKASDTDIRRVMESAHLASLRKGVIYFFSWLLQWIKRISQGCKGLTRPTPIICIWRWQNLSKGSQEGEICHQAGYIVIVSTEFKGKHILEQDELICCAIISSGFKETNICPFLLLEDSRPLFPLWGPWNPFSS